MIMDAEKDDRITPIGKVIYLNDVGADTQKYNDTPSKEELCKEINIPEESHLILSVGELSKRKNHKVAIRGLAQYLEKHMNNGNRQDVHYLIAGIGALDGYLKKLVATLGLKHHVHFLGWREDIAKLCKSVDVFCFPSKREGLPVAVMEAMAAGLPIIASKARGNTELIEDGVNGILCDKNVPEEYAEAYAVMMSKVDYGKWKETSHSKIQRYDIRHVRDKMQRIYESNANVEALKK